VNLGTLCTKPYLDEAFLPVLRNNGVCYRWLAIYCCYLGVRTGEVEGSLAVTRWTKWCAQLSLRSHRHLTPVFRAHNYP
jgi:hypothetical protein